MKRFFTLFIVGFILGPLCDYTHVLSKALDYPHDNFFFYVAGTPYWVPFLFGSATVLIGFSHPFLDRLLRATAERWGSKTFGRVLVGLLGFVALYAVSGYLPGPPLGSAFWILGAGALLMWLALERTWQGLVLALLTAVVGTATEQFMVWQGNFYYLPRVADFWGVPAWLPWLYVGASVGVGNLGRYLARAD